MTRKISLKGFFSNPHRYMRVQWQGPGVDYVDPLRESKAKITEIEAGLRSAQETIISRGRDPEEVLKELKLWQDELDAAGIVLGEPSVANANNPAAVENQGSKGNNGNRAREAALDTFLTELMDKFDEFQAYGPEGTT
ncbi:MAG: hypothetical protein GY868_03460 [Deltaproteobacteria bacterium]|nr:hypothetical protein [Deltaproteobacteria bacterium]